MFKETSYFTILVQLMNDPFWTWLIGMRVVESFKFDHPHFESPRNSTEITSTDFEDDLFFYL
jgi:hypothetical protein